MFISENLLLVSDFLYRSYVALCAVKRFALLMSTFMRICSFCYFSVMLHYDDFGSMVIWDNILNFVCFEVLYTDGYLVSLGKLMEQIDRSVQLVERRGLCES